MSTFLCGVDMMTFPERIVLLKNERNLLQKDIAESIGITVRNYQRYEKGEQQPTLPILVRLADYFDVSLDYLVGRSDDPTRH
jgi:transcriptional regulator with XRE-family HTH domain